MKCVNVFLLALFFSIAASSAHAGSGKTAFFRCGLHLGGTTVDQKTYTGYRKDQGYRTNKRVNLTRTSRPRVAQFATALSKDNGRLRMPPALTLAKFACSWR